MHLRRAAVFLLLSALSAHAYAPVRLTPFDFGSRAEPVNYAASTPLTEIPLYKLEPTAATSDEAVKALALEIERLYTHAKTLDSGHDRRSFETRIYYFEKRLRPLAQSFDLAGWNALRADVRAEWVAVQATLSPPPVIATP